MILMHSAPLIIQNISSSSVDAESMGYFVEFVLTSYKALDIAFFGKTLEMDLCFCSFIC